MSPCWMDVPGGEKLDGVEGAEYGVDHVVHVVQDEPAHQVRLSSYFWLLRQRPEDSVRMHICTNPLSRLTTKVF
jgi:hypothetical protein